MELIFVAIAGAVGYVRLRDFVCSRLRFVDSVQRRSTPWVAGAGAALIALPVVGLLPILGPLTVIVSGVVVGTAVRSGQKQIKLLNR